MNRWTLAIAVTCLAVLAGQFAIVAQDAKPKAKTDTSKDEKPEPTPIDPDDVKAADRLRVQIGPQNAALINSLRYLIRPEFETELMKGRRFRPCVLEPFETRPTRRPDNLQLLRLLAVLKTGIPATSTVEAHVRQFLDTTSDGADLPRLGLEMQIVVAAKMHSGIGWDADLKDRAQTTFDNSQKLRDITTRKSILIKGERLPATWFAHHLWRGVIYSGAIKLALEDLPKKIWSDDLALLNHAYVSKRGWVATKKRADKRLPEISNELNCNLLAMAALQLAHATPEGFLSRGLQSSVMKSLSNAPKVLSRLKEDFDDQGFTGGRMALSLSLGELAPDRTTAELWRDGIREFSCALVDPTGEIPASSDLARELGLTEPNWRRRHAATAETALFLIGLSGGLNPTAPQPLIEEDIKELGHAMYSMAILHADRTGPGGGDFEADVNYALKTGVEYLASIQNEDGSWPGTHTNRAGNTSLSMLAMLHGGWKQDSIEINSGLKVLMKQADEQYVMTYDAACVLMFFQKYYATAQRDAGILSARNKSDFNKA
ncbi:hypothetical protein OAU50_03700, partial [Planctomycetota bacterium]|nr:hypothetical protein [Planctomycetota bacterium]